MYPVEELCDIAEQLGDDEVEVLLSIARRVLRGREQYGELDIDSDDRDWRQEGQEERLDLIVYDAIQHVKDSRRPSRGRG